MYYYINEILVLQKKYSNLRFLGVKIMLYMKKLKVTLQVFRKIGYNESC